MTENVGTAWTKLLSPCHFAIKNTNKTHTMSVNLDAIEYKIDKALSLHRAGCVTSYIANELNVSVRTIQRYVKRGEFGHTDRKPVAPRVTTPANVAKVRRTLISQPNMSKRKAAAILQSSGTKISPSSVLNAVKKTNLHKFSLKRKPPLNPNHRAKRLKFAKDHAERKWKTVLFVDEAGIQLTAKPNSKTQGQWATSAREVAITPRYKHPASINVFAGVCWTGRTKLVTYTGTMTGARYASILDDILPEMTSAVFKSRKWKVVQDAVPLHFTKEVQDVFKLHNVDFIDKKSWPPNSPDLNVIEHVWAVLKQRVDERGPRTVQDLKLFASEEWEKIPQSMMQNCIFSLINRLDLVRKKKESYSGK